MQYSLKVASGRLYTATLVRVSTQGALREPIMLRCLDRHQFAIAHHRITLWHLQASQGFPTLRVRPLAFIGLQLLLCISLARAAPPMLPKGGHFVAGSGSIADGGQSLTVKIGRAHV